MVFVWQTDVREKLHCIGAGGGPKGYTSEGTNLPSINRGCMSQAISHVKFFFFFFFFFLRSARVRADSAKHWYSIGPLLSTCWQNLHKWNLNVEAVHSTQHSRNWHVPNKRASKFASTLNPPQSYVAIHSLSLKSRSLSLHPNP